MTYTKNRKSTRLAGFDYSAEAAYFITLLTKDRTPFFGEVRNGEMILSEIGKIAKEELLRTPEIRKNVTIDEWVIMPDHLHCIVVIGDPIITLPGVRGTILTGEKAAFASPKRTIGAIVRGLKGATVKRVNEHFMRAGEERTSSMHAFGWQRNYHDRIIRNQQELLNVQNYIRNNPSKWEKL